MLEFLQYVSAFVILAQAAEPSSGAATTPDWTGIALCITAFALASRVIGALLARGVGAGVGLPTVMLAAAAGRLTSLFVFWAIAQPLGGVAAPQALGIETWFFVPTFVALAPFFALVAALAWGLQPAARALRVGARTPAGAVRAEFQRALLPMASIVACVLLGEILRLAARDETSVVGRAVAVLFASPAIHAFFWLTVVFGVLLVVPFAFRLAIRARPLEDGPLRRRLEAYSRRVGFRARDILVWKTDGTTLNAAVIGALPRFRYAVLTDGLLETLDEDEIEAVFAHEAGHARRGHVLLFFGFTAVLALVQLVPGTDEVVGGGALEFLPPVIRPLVPIVVWIGVVFGWISRRFEQEADVFGVDTLPHDPAAGADHPFARALERIGREVGGIREVTGWRHFSIADRVAFVRLYVADAEVRRRWRRSIMLLRVVLLTLIGGFALAAAVRVPGELLRARSEWEARSNPENKLLRDLHRALDVGAARDRAESFESAGVHAFDAGRREDSARWLRESVALEPRRATALMSYAEVLATSGRPLGAKLVWAEVAAMEDAPAAAREDARRKAAAHQR